MFEFSARKLTPTNFEWKPQFKLYRYHLCCNLIPNNSHIQKMINKISPTFWSSNYNSGAQKINDQIYFKNSSDLVPICPYVILFLEKNVHVVGCTISLTRMKLKPAVVLESNLLLIKLRLWTQLSRGHILPIHETYS